MERFKPKTDKLFYITAGITFAVLLGLTVPVALYPHPLPLLIVIFTDLFSAYFLLSPLFGYVELREDTVFIKLGFILKREIPYSKIRGTSKERKWHSDSMMSLKNSLEHVNIKYNTFDILSVSVVNNDELIRELNAKR